MSNTTDERPPVDAGRVDADVRRDWDDLDVDFWLCPCGHFEESSFHCDKCGGQPPWGCDCAACESELDDTERHEWNEAMAQVQVGAWDVD